MRLILIRHGETQLNRDGRVQGRDSEPLNRTGRAQARAVAGALSGDAPFALYASPLTRAMETAQAISDAFQVPCTPLRGLEEIDTGELNGLTGQEMKERFPELMQEWDRNPASVRMPGGESMVEVRQRAWKAVTTLLERHDEQTAVAVSHNFAICTIVCKVLGTPLRHFRRLNQELGAITRLHVGGDWGALVSFNETWHLKSIRPRDRSGG